MYDTSKAKEYVCRRTRSERDRITTLFPIKEHLNYAIACQLKDALNQSSEQYIATVVKGKVNGTGRTLLTLI